MEGSYPILIDGVQTGTLTVARDGLMTVFLAECEDPGWLLRLAVYGPEGTGYLGVMIPEGGRLRLKKRLSRAALAGFPSQLRFAGPAGMAAPEEASGQAEPAEEPAPEQEKASDAPAEAPAPARQAAAAGRVPSDRVRLGGECRRAAAADQALAGKGDVPESLGKYRRLRRRGRDEPSGHPA